MSSQAAVPQRRPPSVPATPSRPRTYSIFAGSQAPASLSERRRISGNVGAGPSGTARAQAIMVVSSDEEARQAAARRGRDGTAHGLPPANVPLALSSDDDIVYIGIGQNAVASSSTVQKLQGSVDDRFKVTAKPPLAPKLSRTASTLKPNKRPPSAQDSVRSATEKDRASLKPDIERSRALSGGFGSHKRTASQESKVGRRFGRTMSREEAPSPLKGRFPLPKGPETIGAGPRPVSMSRQSSSSSVQLTEAPTERPLTKELMAAQSSARHFTGFGRHRSTSQTASAKNLSPTQSTPLAPAGSFTSASRAGPSKQTPPSRHTFDPAPKRMSTTPRQPPSSSSPSSNGRLAVFREMAAIVSKKERPQPSLTAPASSSSQRPTVVKASPTKAALEAGSSSQRRLPTAPPGSQRSVSRAAAGETLSAARRENLRDHPAARATAPASSSTPDYDDGIIPGSSKTPLAISSSARTGKILDRRSSRPSESEATPTARRDRAPDQPNHRSRASGSSSVPRTGSQSAQRHSRTPTVNSPSRTRPESALGEPTPRLPGRASAVDGPLSNASESTPRSVPRKSTGLDPPRRPATPAAVARPSDSTSRSVRPKAPAPAVKPERSAPPASQGATQRHLALPTQKRKRSGENDDDDAFRPGSQAVRTASSRTSSGEQSTRAKRARPPAGSMAVPSYDAPEEAWSKNMSGRPRAKPMTGQGAAEQRTTAPAPAARAPLSASSTLSSLPSTASPVKKTTTPRPLHSSDHRSPGSGRRPSATEQGLSHGTVMAAHTRVDGDDRMLRMASSSLTELGSQTTPSRRAAREDKPRSRDGTKSISQSRSRLSSSPLKRNVTVGNGEVSPPEAKEAEEGAVDLVEIATETEATPLVDAVPPAEDDPFAEFAEYEFKEFTPEPELSAETAPVAVKDNSAQRPTPPMILPILFPGTPQTPGTRGKSAVPRTVHVERRRLQPYSPVQRKQRMSLSPSASRRTLSFLTVTGTSNIELPEPAPPPVELTPHEMALKRDAEREALRVLERQKAAERRAAVEADIARRAEAEQADEDSDEGSNDLLKMMRTAVAGPTLAVPGEVAAPGARRSSRLGSGASDQKVKDEHRSRSPSVAVPVPRPKKSANPLLAALREMEREKRLGLWGEVDEALPSASASDSGSEAEGSEAGVGGDEDAEALLDRVGKFTATNAAVGEKLDSELLRSVLTKKGSAEKCWEGFWEGGYETKGECAPDVILAPQELWLAPFVDMARSGDFGPLGYIISGLEVSPAMVGFVVDTVLPRILTNASDHPFGSSAELLGRVIATIQSLGARDVYVLLPATDCGDLNPFNCGGAREEVCYVLAIIVRVAAENRWLDMADAVVFAPTLLMLAMDPTVMYTALGSAIRDALAALWPLCMDCLAPIEMARVLCEFLARLPASHRWLAFETIGSGSPQAREVARWVGMEMVIPGILSKLSGDRVLVVPSAEMLYDAASCVLNTVLGRTKPTADAGSEVATPASAPGNITDHLLLRAQVAGLYAAMNDIEETLGTTPGKVQIVRERFERVGGVIKRASDLIKRHSLGAVETLNKMHLGQLAAVFSMQVNTALERRKRMEQRARLRGSGLRVGSSAAGGQTVLAFKKRKREDKREDVRELAAPEEMGRMVRTGGDADEIRTGGVVSSGSTDAGGDVEAGGAGVNHQLPDAISSFDAGEEVVAGSSEGDGEQPDASLVAAATATATAAASAVQANGAQPHAGWAIPNAVSEGVRCGFA